jgi:hypothetical protein
MTPEETMVLLAELSKDIDALRTVLIESSPLDKERKEYYNKVEQLEFIMEEVMMYQEDEETEY